MRMRSRAALSRIAGLGIGLAALLGRADDLKPVPLRSKVANVQPMTGIVLWATNERASSAPIQLEYSYVTYSQVVKERGVYDWSAVERILNEVAKRKHQAIIRWHETYVAKTTGVPAYIKALPDYREITALSERKRTGFPDWSHPELRRFILEFYERFAEKYDHDPRLAFMQTGFGLWSEYHIYDGPMKLGQTFPSLEFQREFVEHLSRSFKRTPWMISVDAAGDHAPYANDQKLLALSFGLFDDSFNHAHHARVNELNWNRLGRDRWKIAPGGGEFSFYETKDQREALSPTGPHGTSFEQHAAKFHISFMIGDGQPRFQKPERIREAGMACGYRFRVAEFKASPSQAVVVIQNTGIAPIYHDAFPAVDGTRAGDSLKGLLPGQSKTFTIPLRVAGESATSPPILTIDSDRLVPGQRIEYDADLP